MVLLMPLIAFVAAMALAEAYTPRGIVPSGTEVGWVAAGTMAGAWAATRLWAKAVVWLQRSRAGTWSRRGEAVVYLVAVGATVMSACGGLSGWCVGKGMGRAMEALVLSGVFFAALAAGWWGALPLEKAAGRVGVSRAGYVWKRVRFVLPVAVPWVAGEAAIEGLEAAGVGGWMDRGWGQLLGAGLFIVLMALGLAVVVRWWWGGERVEGRVREVIEQVFERAGVRVRDVVYWEVLEGWMVSAGVVGLMGRFSYLMLSPSLVHMLTPHQLQAVVAHEAGHLKGKHMWVYLVLLMGLLVGLWGLGPVVEAGVWAGVWLGTRAGWDLSEGAGWDVVIALGMVGMVAGYVRYGMGPFIRAMERQADLFALKLMGSSQGLVEALEKIAVASGLRRSAPSWHHYSIAERVAFLRRAEAEPALAKAHTRKLRRAWAIYILVLTTVVGVGQAMEAWGVPTRARAAAVAQLARRQLALHPSPRARLALGVALYEQGRYKAAAAELEKALAQAPSDPEILNALAWVLATATDPAVRNPARAVALARQAVAMAPVAHIWDTLAEALMAAGKPARALAAAQAAIRAPGAKERMDYYRRQLKRFRAALEQR